MYEKVVIFFLLVFFLRLLLGRVCLAGYVIMFFRVDVIIY